MNEGIKEYTNKYVFPIKAVQWTGDNTEQVAELIGNDKIEAIYDNKYMIINDVLVHPIVACIGDYIYKDFAGDIIALYERDFKFKFKLLDERTINY